MSHAFLVGVKVMYMKRSRLIISLLVFATLAFSALKFLPKETGDIKKDIEIVLGEDSASLSAGQFHEKIMFDNQVLLLDVRSPGELMSGAIDGALNINLYNFSFEKKVNHLDKKRTVMVYCSSGSRSSEAVKVLKKNGFSKVFELNGGFREWKSKGYPVFFKEKNTIAE